MDLGLLTTDKQNCLALARVEPLIAQKVDWEMQHRTGLLTFSQVGDLFVKQNKKITSGRS